MSTQQKKIVVTVVIILMIVFMVGCITEKAKTTSPMEKEDSTTIESETVPLLENKANDEMFKVFTYPNSNLYVKDDKAYDFSYSEGIAIVKAYNLFSGEEIWQWEDDWEDSGEILGADSDSLYIERDSQNFVLNIANGALIRKDIAEGFYPADIIDSKSDKISFYLHDLVGDKEIVAFDKKEGKLLWYISIPRDFYFNEKYNLFLIETGRYDMEPVKAIDAFTGEEKYQINNNWCDELVNDKDYFLSGFTNGYAETTLSKNDVKNGSEIWSINEFIDYADIIKTENKIYLEDDMLYQKKLTVVDVATGDFWERDLNESTFLGEIDNKVIFCNHGSGHTTAVDAKNGQELWINDDLDIYRLSGVHEGGLLVQKSDLSGQKSDWLYKINKDTGEKIWRLNIEDDDMGFYQYPESRAKNEFVVNNFLISVGADTVTFYDVEKIKKKKEIEIPYNILKIEQKENYLILSSEEDLNSFTNNIVTIIEIKGLSDSK